MASTGPPDDVREYLRVVHTQLKMAESYKAQRTPLKNRERELCPQVTEYLQSQPRLELCLDGLSPEETQLLGAPGKLRLIKKVDLRPLTHAQMDDVMCRFFTTQVAPLLKPEHSSPAQLHNLYTLCADFCLANRKKVPSEKLTRVYSKKRARED
jgi:hypothetical protein